MKLFCRFVVSKFLKTCDELYQACISLSLTDSSRRLRSKLNQIVDTTLAKIEIKEKIYILEIKSCGFESRIRDVEAEIYKTDLISWLKFRLFFISFW